MTTLAVITAEGPLREVAITMHPCKECTPIAVAADMAGTRTIPMVAAAAAVIMAATRITTKVVEVASLRTIKVVVTEEEEEEEAIMANSFSSVRELATIMEEVDKVLLVEDNFKSEILACPFKEAGTVDKEIFREVLLAIWVAHAT